MTEEEQKDAINQHVRFTLDTEEIEVQIKIPGKKKKCTLDSINAKKLSYRNHKRQIFTKKVSKEFF